MTATFRIDQPGITGGKPPVGTWGEARADLDLSSAGGTVEFTAQDTSTNYLWQLISEVDGSAITLGTADEQTATADITVTGGYLIRLTIDEGLSTKDIQERYFGVPLPGSGLPIPALNETIQDNRDTVNPGYERKMTAWMKFIDAAIAPSFGVFEQPAGTVLSSVRTDSNAVVEGDYSFSAGAINLVDSDSSFAFVFGGGTAGENANDIVDSAHVAVLGWNNRVEHGDLSVLQGLDNTVWGNYNRVFGYDNAVGTDENDRIHAIVMGQACTVDADFVTALGEKHRCDEDGGYSTLLGSYAIARWPGSLYHSMGEYLSNGAGQNILSTHVSEVTTDENWERMALISGGSMVELEMRNQTIYLCELRLIARTADSTGDPSALKTWIVRFTAHNDYDNNAVLFPVDKVILAETALENEGLWDVDVAVSMAPSVTPQIKLNVKGESGVVITWYGVLHTVYLEDILLTPPE